VWFYRIRKWKGARGGNVSASLRKTIDQGVLDYCIHVTLDRVSCLSSDGKTCRRMMDKADWAYTAKSKAETVWWLRALQNETPTKIFILVYCCLLF